MAQQWVIYGKPGNYFNVDEGKKDAFKNVARI